MVSSFKKVPRRGKRYIIWWPGTIFNWGVMTVVGSTWLIVIFQVRSREMNK